MMIVVGMLLFAPSLLILLFFIIAIVWFIGKLIGVDILGKIKGDDNTNV